MPLSFAQPVAVMVMYDERNADVANAGISVNVSSAFYIATRIR